MTCTRRASFCCGHCVFVVTRPFASFISLLLRVPTRSLQRRIARTVRRGVWHTVSALLYEQAPRSVPYGTTTYTERETGVSVTSDVHSAPEDAVAVAALLMGLTLLRLRGVRLRFV